MAVHRCLRASTSRTSAQFAKTRTDKGLQQMKTQAPGEVENAIDSETRAEMIERWMPLVRFAVRRMATGGKMRFFDRDDLVSYGSIGLIQAVDRFDPERGVNFQAYALSRIRGSILDALRATDIIPRGLRARVTTIDRATDSLSPELGRPPTRAEIRHETGLTDQDYDRATTAAQTKVVSLEMLSGCDADDDPERVGRLQLTSPDEPAILTILRRERHEALAAAVATLPERDRLVLSLYYVEELSLKAIAAVLDISESRVNQLKTRAINRLRNSSALQAVA